MRRRLPALLVALALALVTAGCGGEGSEQGPTPGVEGTADEGSVAPGLPKGSAAAGSEVFAQHCSTCHGAAGDGGSAGPNLQDAEIAEDLDAVARQVTEGGGGMPAFGDILSDQEIADVTTYVVERISGR